MVVFVVFVVVFVFTDVVVVVFVDVDVVVVFVFKHLFHYSGDGTTNYVYRWVRALKIGTWG